MVLETDRTCRTDPFGSLLLLPIYALEGIRHTGGSGRQAGWEQSGCHIPPDRHSQHYNGRSEEHTSELQSLMRSSYAVFCLTHKKLYNLHHNTNINHTHVDT